MEITNDLTLIFWLGTSITLLFTFGRLFIKLFYQRHSVTLKQEEAQLLLKTTLQSEKQGYQDIDDGLQEDLNVVRNYVKYPSRIIKSLHLTLVEAMKIALKVSLQNIHLISHKLMPPLLKTAEFGIIAINIHLDSLNQSSAQRLTINSTLPTVKIPTAVFYELYHIVQKYTTHIMFLNAILCCDRYHYETFTSIKLASTDNGISLDFKQYFINLKVYILSHLKSIAQTWNKIP